MSQQRAVRSSTFLIKRTLCARGIWATGGCPIESAPGAASSDDQASGPTSASIKSFASSLAISVVAGCLLVSAPLPPPEFPFHFPYRFPCRSPAFHRRFHRHFPVVSPTPSPTFTERQASGPGKGSGKPSVLLPASCSSQPRHRHPSFPCRFPCRFPWRFPGVSLAFRGRFTGVYWGVYWGVFGSVLWGVFSGVWGRSSRNPNVSTTVQVAEPFTVESFGPVPDRADHVKVGELRVSRPVPPRPRKSRGSDDTPVTEQRDISIRRSVDTCSAAS